MWQYTRIVVSPLYSRSPPDSRNSFSRFLYLVLQYPGMTYFLGVRKIKLPANILTTVQSLDFCCQYILLCQCAALGKGVESAQQWCGGFSALDFSRTGRLPVTKYRTTLTLQYCSPVLRTNYFEFDWFVPKTRLQC